MRPSLARSGSPARLKLCDQLTFVVDLCLEVGGALADIADRVESEAGGRDSTAPRRSPYFSSLIP